MFRLFRSLAEECNGLVSIFIKEMNNAPECIVELYKHTEFLRTRVKNPQVLIKLNNARGKVLYFFYKMFKKLRALKLVM